MYDVIILGLGGMGSAAAAHLAQRGQRVLGLEQFGSAHDYGSSHGESRVVRQSYFEGPAYVPLLTRAYELWDDLDLLTLTGGLYVGAQGSSAVVGARRAAEEHDLPHELLDSRDVRRRFPTFAPSADEVALYEPRAGWVRPEATVTAHLERAARAGAQLGFHSPVVSWSERREEVVVTTAGGARHTAGRLVVAAGAWAPNVLLRFNLPLTVTRQVLAWFTPRSAGFDDPRHPVFLHDPVGGLMLYGLPQVGSTVKVALFYGGAETTPDTVDRTITPEEIDALRAAAERIVPGAAGAATRAATCLYTLTPDHHFVIDRPSDRVLIVSCCSGHGFKFVPVIGEIVADLIVDGQTRHPIEPFAADRF